MKISQIIVETATTAGSVATVSKPLGEVQSRIQVSGLQPAEKIMRGSTKKKGPYANSLSEGAVKQLSMDLKELKDDEFKKKYNKTKQEARTALKAKPEPVKEAKLEEDDVILVPGQGRVRKSGFIKHDPDKAEHEGETLKNSLHTIIRVASHLDKELSVRDSFPEWVSEKIGAVKSNMVTVMDYLISAKEMKRDPDAMNEGSQRVDSLVTDALKIMRGAEVSDAIQALKTVLGDREFSSRRGHYNFYVRQLMDMYGQKNMAEGAKVDRMVKHIEKSEKKLGHSKKEAENIAWATANKRGMLDNKNKKAK